jgi:glutathionylspermidine synthase
VDCVYRFFNEQDVLRSPSLYRGPLAALNAGAITMPMGPHYSLINNKGVLAMLWDLCEHGQLSASEEAVIREWLAPTLWLSVRNVERIAREREQWVLKPIDGACGRDVWCGGEMSDAAWRQRLNAVLALGRRRFVAQRFASPEQAEVAITGRHGETVGHQYKIVWGAYVFGEDYLGLLVRAKPPEGTAVINHATGAVVGPLGPPRSVTERG